MKIYQSYYGRLGNVIGNVYHAFEIARMYNVEDKNIFFESDYDRKELNFYLKDCLDFFNCKENFIPSIKYNQEIKNLKKVSVSDCYKKDFKLIENIHISNPYYSVYFKKFDLNLYKKLFFKDFYFNNKTDYVGISIRLGNYLTFVRHDGVKYSKFIINPEKYIEILKKLDLFDKKKLIFSDSIETCKKIDFGPNTFFHENINAYQDLIRLSSCKYLIANVYSSFCRNAEILHNILWDNKFCYMLWNGIKKDENNLKTYHWNCY